MQAQITLGGPVPVTVGSILSLLAFLAVYALIRNSSEAPDDKRIAEGEKKLMEEMLNRHRDREPDNNKK